MCIRFYFAGKSEKVSSSAESIIVDFQFLSILLIGREVSRSYCPYYSVSIFVRGGGQSPEFINIGYGLSSFLSPMLPAISGFLKPPIVENLWTQVNTTSISMLCLL